MTLTRFGTAPDGSAVLMAKLAGGGLFMNLISWGAVVQDLRLAAHEPPLVLGFNEFDHYLQHSPYFGATAGRFANRIAGGRFSIGGHAYQADRNFLGKHTLHGGAQGVGKRNWRFVSASAAEAVLELHDGEGAMGFPGNCRLQATFSLPGDGVLSIVYSATTDQPTLVNLAHHSYFALDDSGDIRDHEIRIDAGSYLPVDDELIPTGQVAAVANTPFDFTAFGSIRAAQGAGGLVLDHNYCLSNGRVAVRPVASARSLRSGLAMDVETTEPGLQFYAGHKVNTPVPGLTGKPYGAYAGFCFEPQIWPDAPNHPHFPQALLMPGETRRQETRYRFSPRKWRE